MNTKKLTVCTFIILSLICAATVTSFAIDRSYDEDLITITEQRLDLNSYTPFAEDTKAVKLNEPATFKITANPPKLDGATAFYPLYAAFVQATYPEKDFTAWCSTTPYAYTSLINGDVDIIFVFEPSKQQLDEAKKKGVELKFTPIGLDAFVFFVNATNEVKDLSVRQIQGIYAGEITNWQQVGAKSESIRAFQRSENSGSQTILQKLMEGKTLMTPLKENIALEMSIIIERTANYRNYNNAIGYSFLFFATQMAQNNQIRLLKVDSVYPDRDTIKNKSYPLIHEIYAVTAGSKNENVEPFIAWILSRQGQQLIEDTGYTAIGKY